MQREIQLAVVARVAVVDDCGDRPHFSHILEKQDRNTFASYIQSPIVASYYGVNV